MISWIACRWDGDWFCNSATVVWSVEGEKYLKICSKLILHFCIFLWCGRWYICLSRIIAESSSQQIFFTSIHSSDNLYRVSQKKTEFYWIEHLQICHKYQKYFSPTDSRISKCSIWQNSVFLRHPLAQHWSYSHSVLTFGQFLWHAAPRLVL